MEGNGCLGGITDEGVKATAGLRNLESLNIPISTDAGMDVLRNFTNLRRMIVERPPAVTAKGLASISELRKLRSSGVHLPPRPGGIAPGAVGDPGRTSVGWRSCPSAGAWTTRGWRSLAALAKLRRLDLRLCSGFTDAGLAGLVRACRISRHWISPSQAHRRQGPRVPGRSPRPKPSVDAMLNLSEPGRQPHCVYGPLVPPGMTAYRTGGNFGTRSATPTASRTTLPTTSSWPTTATATTPAASTTTSSTTRTRCAYSLTTRSTTRPATRIWRRSPSTKRRGRPASS